jgi:signal transduction histidine kinase
MQRLAQASQIAPSQLADGFSAFIAAANRLEDSHRQLHNEVGELRRQLEERNRALASSVAETERMRVALRQIVDALPCGVAVLETRMEEVILLNPEARRLLAMEGPGGWSNLPESIQRAVMNVNHDSLERGYEQELMVEKDAHQRCLAIRYSRMTSPATRNNGADASCLVLIITDVTAYKEMQEKREKSRNVVALGEMATVLAHEIRNPLGSLELLTGCLAGDVALGDESRRCVQHLKAGVRSLSATVNNVLSFHSPAAQQMVALNVGTALKVIVEFVRPLAQQKGVELNLWEDLKDAEMLGNSSGLRQIILNLVCNALRHTQPDGAIEISGSVEGTARGRNVVICVVDSGSGIRPEDMPHIFQGGFSTTGQTPGLGLTVCQRIVEQHRGTIAVQSQLGKGTTFRMEFPAL